jgi:hypothetical protein
VGDDRQIAQRHKGNPVGPGRARATLQRNIGIGGAIATPKSANCPSVAKRAQGANRRARADPQPARERGLHARDAANGLTEVETAETHVALRPLASGH